MSEIMFWFPEDSEGNRIHEPDSEEGEFVVFDNERDCKYFEAGYRMGEKKC